MTFDFLIYGIAAVLGLALVPAVYVFVREMFKRRVASRSVERVAEARALLEETAKSGQSVEFAAEALRKRLDEFSLNQAIEERLESGDKEVGPWALQAFHELKLHEQHLETLKNGKEWNERAHSARILGLAQVVEAVPLLLAAIRDRYEDANTVKVAAAEALACINNDEAIPMLVHELTRLDEWSSPQIPELLVSFGERVVPELLTLLKKEGEANAAVWAVRILGRVGSADAVPMLLLRLGDRHQELRVAVAEALGLLADRRAIQPLIQATLRDPIPQVRSHAAGALGQMGDDSTVETLIAALADPDYGTRVRVLEALENMRPKDTRAMERALRDTNRDVRRRAALALERVGFLEAKVNALADSDPHVVDGAFDSILELGRVGLVDSIAGHLHHEDFRVRAHVVRACGELADRRVAPLLVAALDDESWPVRARLCEAIGRLRPDDGARALAALLTDEAIVVAEHAAEAMLAFDASRIEPVYGQVLQAFDRDSAALRASVVTLASHHQRGETAGLLQRAVKDPADIVRLRALEALTENPLPNITSDLIECLADTELPVRCAAVSAIGVVPSRTRLETLLKALPVADPGVRERIALALSKGGLAPFLELTEGMVTDPDQNLQLGIIWTLGKIADPAGVPQLSRFLESPNARLRSSASGALGKIPNPDAARAVFSARRDPDPKTRAAVTNALGKIGYTIDRNMVLEALEELVRDPDDFIRNRAAIALGRAGGQRSESLLLHRQTEALVVPKALAVALGILGTERGLRRASEYLARKQVAEDVEAFLQREEPEVRRAFYKGLHLTDEEEQLEQGLAQADMVERYQTTLQNSRKVESRKMAVLALSRLEGIRAVDLLCDALATDPAEEVRFQAVEGVARHWKQPRVLSVLQEAVADPSPRVAVGAIVALGQSRSEAAGSRLFERLGRGAHEVQQAVEDALASIFAAEPHDFVDLFLGAEQTMVMVAGVRVLKRIAKPLLVPILGTLLRSNELLVRLAAVDALGEVPLADSKEALRIATQDASEEVREAAVDSLTKTLEPDSLEYVFPLVVDPSTAVRSMVSRRITGFEYALVAELFFELLDDPSPEVQAVTLVSLLSTGKDVALAAFSARWREVAPDIRRRVRGDKRAHAVAEVLAPNLFVGCPDPVMRVNTVTSIAALEPEGFEDYLLPGLRDPEPAVRKMTMQVLTRSERADVREQTKALMMDPDVEVREAAKRANLQVVGN